MKTPSNRWALLVLPVLSAAPITAQQVTAFTGVTVIPMDRERRLTDQTVIVRDGRIAQIGAAGRVTIPAGATQIDGRGKFLLPGFVDMHAHLAPGAGELSDGAGRQLALSMANGVTTVRSLISPPSSLPLRERLRSGAIVGPRLVLAGGSVNGGSAATPEAVVRLVTQQKADGYDLIKTHGQFPDPAIYDSLAAVTKRLGMPLVGHVSPEFGLRKAHAAGQQVEHLDGFLQEVVRDGVTVPPGQFVFDLAVLDAVDTAKVRALAREIARRKLWNAPTLELFRVVAGSESAEHYSGREEFRYSPKLALDGWIAQKNAMLAQPIPAEARRRYLEFRNLMVRELHAAGAKLLASSDSPQFFMTPGFGMHRELQAMVDAGLSPYAALETATRNPAEWFNDLVSRGTVTEGKVADLVLLDADPLLQISNSMRVAGVMIGGKWQDRAALEALKLAVAKAVGNG